jgi:hypothetical protein
MRIKFKRTGGFGGPAMKQEYAVDLDTLPEHEAAELEELVQKVDVAALASQQVSSQPLPDAFHYRLVIDGPAGRHAIQASDADMPVLLRPLIQWLSEHATSR